MVRTSSRRAASRGAPGPASDAVGGGRTRAVRSRRACRGGGRRSLPRRGQDPPLPRERETPRRVQRAAGSANVASEPERLPDREPFGQLTRWPSATVGRRCSHAASRAAYSRPVPTTSTTKRDTSSSAARGGVCRNAAVVPGYRARPRPYGRAASRRAVTGPVRQRERARASWGCCPPEYERARLGP